MGELESIKEELNSAWKEHLKDDPTAIGTLIQAMNHLVNYLIDDRDL